MKPKIKNIRLRVRRSHWHYLVLFCPHCGNRTISSRRIRHTWRRVSDWLTESLNLELRFKKPPEILFAKTEYLPKEKKK